MPRFPDPFHDRKHQDWVKYLAGFHASKHRLTIGDVVVLNSGGREGLVVDLDGDGNITVSTFCDEGDYEEVMLPEIMFTCIRTTAR